METVRYYQRIGLLTTPERLAGGFRSYQKADVDRLRFVRSAQQLGFSLEDIAGLMRLSGDDCEDVQTLAQRKLVLVREKVTDLARMEKALVTVLARCRAREPRDGCPVIAALSNGTDKPAGSHFICRLDSAQTIAARHSATGANFSTSLPPHPRTATGAKVSGAVRKPTPSHSGKEFT